MRALRCSKKFYMMLRAATMLAVLGFSVPSLATAGSYATNSRQQFVDKGKLHAGVKYRVEQTGEADIILVLNDSDVTSMADWIKERLGIRNDSPEITALAGLPAEACLARRRESMRWPWRRTGLHRRRKHPWPCRGCEPRRPP